MVYTQAWDYNPGVYDLLVNTTWNLHGKFCIDSNVNLPCDNDFYIDFLAIMNEKEQN